MFKDRFLRLEIQQIVVAPETFVKRDPDRVQELPRAGDIFGLGSPYLREPMDHVQIAQRAGVLLHVRLEMIDGSLVLGVAGARGFRKLLRNGAPLGSEKLGKAHLQVREPPWVPADEALIEKADGELEVALVQLARIGDGAHRMAYVQAFVPQDAQELGEWLFVAWMIGQLVDQQQQVDIGIGKQLPAAITADGDYREIRLGAVERGSHGAVHAGGAVREHEFGRYRFQFRQREPSPRSPLRIRMASATS